MGYVGLSVNRARKYIANNNSQVWRFLVLNMLLKLSRLRGNSYYIFTYFSLSNMYVFFFCKYFFLIIFLGNITFLLFYMQQEKLYMRRLIIWHGPWHLVFFFFFGSFMAMRIFFGSFILIENLLFFKSIFFMW